MTKNKLIKIKKFFSQFPVKKFAKGDYIVKPGDVFENVYYNKSGFGRIYSKTAKGDSVINIFRPSFLLSYIHFLTDHRNDFYIQAITPVELYVAPFSDFKKFLDEDPEINTYILDHFFGSLLNFFVNQGNIINGSSECKVASILLQITHDYGELKNSKLMVNFPATHRIIAGLVGLTRETTSVQMSRLQKKGVISTKRTQFVVHDLEKLKKLAQISD